MKSIRIIFAIFAVMVLVSCESIDVKQEQKGAFSISENKNYLNDIGNNINYFGYLGFFELISAFDFILLKILSK